MRSCAPCSAVATTPCPHRRYHAGLIGRPGDTVKLIEYKCRCPTVARAPQHRQDRHQYPIESGARRGSNVRSKTRETLGSGTNPVAISSRFVACTLALLEIVGTHKEVGATRIIVQRSR